MCDRDHPSKHGAAVETHREPGECVRDTEKETRGEGERDGEIRGKMAKGSEWGLLKGVRGEEQVREEDRRKEFQRGKGYSHQTIHIHCLY